MQFWIFYLPGVGGDGFSNLLEHATNVLPSDGNTGWKIHWQRDGIVKFHGPNWAQDPIPFRSHSLNKHVMLNEHYVSILNKNLNTVIPTHPDGYWQHIDQSPIKDVVEKNQVKIHLYSNDYQRVMSDFANKSRPGPHYLTLGEFTNRNSQNLSNPAYALHIDIERAWREWDYLEKCLIAIDINLDRCYYNDYLKLINKI